MSYVHKTGLKLHYLLESTVKFFYIISIDASSCCVSPAQKEKKLILTFLKFMVSSKAMQGATLMSFCILCLQMTGQLFHRVHLILNAPFRSF